MHDDLILRLREAAKMSEALAVLLPHSEGNATAKLYNEAADAIGELMRRCEQFQYMPPPAWIPVAEALPENDTAVLAHVYWPEYGDTMICYGHWHKGWFHLFHHVEGELISGYVVTHWMPLPQPPEEE